MLSNTVRANYFLLFLLIILITSHVRTSGVEAAESGSGPTHMNFFRSGMMRRRHLSCAKDPRVCMDREKNPWGGSTCCFRQFCKDTLRDPYNCGACGLKCGFGFVCCDGKCADIQNDPSNCGSCFEKCPSPGKCSFAMCDYGGG